MTYSVFWTYTLQVAKEVHPDRNSGAESDHFHAAKNAYDVSSVQEWNLLINSRLRCDQLLKVKALKEAYDEHLKEHPNASVEQFQSKTGVSASTDEFDIKMQRFLKSKGILPRLISFFLRVSNSYQLFSRVFNCGGLLLTVITNSKGLLELHRCRANNSCPIESSAESWCSGHDRHVCWWVWEEIPWCPAIPTS